MIDRILCVCQTKGESLKWVDHLRQQIKSSRQPSQGPNVSNTSLIGGHIGSTGGVGGLGNPPPPPHVSLNHQPFELLTVWIRNQLVDGKFTREELIKMTKREYFSKSFQESHDGAVPENCAGGSVRATLSLSPLAGVLWAEIVNQVAPAGLTALLSLLMFDFPDDRL